MGGIASSTTRVTCLATAGIAALLLADCQPAAAQAPPLLADLGQLKLRVANTAVVPRISDRIQSKLSPRPGNQLVVVTLKGTATRPCRIVLDTREFAAVYEHQGTGPGGRRETQVEVNLSAAIAEGDSAWSIPPQGSTAAVATYPIRKPGPVTLRVAILLPQEVRSFTVRYPTTAQGKAQVQARPPRSSR